MEKSRFSAQKNLGRFEQIKTQILSRATLFTRQGIVVATWRKYGSARLGPYFRLKYYEGSVQRSIYLGARKNLPKRSAAGLPVCNLGGPAAGCGRDCVARYALKKHGYKKTSMPGGIA